MTEHSLSFVHCHPWMVCKVNYPFHVFRTTYHAPLKSCCMRRVATVYMPRCVTQMTCKQSESSPFFAHLAAETRNFTSEESETRFDLVLAWGSEIHYARAYPRHRQGRSPPGGSR